MKIVQKEREREREERETDRETKKRDMREGMQRQQRCVVFVSRHVFIYPSERLYGFVTSNQLCYRSSVGERWSGRDRKIEPKSDEYRTDRT